MNERGTESPDEEISDAEMGEMFFKAWGADLVESGEIDPKGLTQEEFDIAIRNNIRETFKLNPDHKFMIRIDHKASLLNQARDFHKDGKYEFSIVFYAIWIEHFINWMLISKMNRLDIHASNHADVLRQPFQQKIGIVWKLLFGNETLDEQLVKDILKIAEMRNSFVHYKWNNVDPNLIDPNDMNSESRDLITLAESTVSSLNSFHSEKVFGGLAES